MIFLCSYGYQDTSNISQFLFRRINYSVENVWHRKKALRISGILPLRLKKPILAEVSSYFDTLFFTHKMVFTKFLLPIRFLLTPSLYQEDYVQII